MALSEWPGEALESLGAEPACGSWGRGQEMLVRPPQLGLGS